MTSATGTFGEFLRTRRAQLNPEDLGLVDGRPRRVPGLRREELAQLAGVSVDYYVRMEQGRIGGVSDAILDAVARALRLDPDEREHLGRLARHRPAKTRPAAPERVRPPVRWLLDTMRETPAFVMGRRADILAWNDLAAALVTDFGSLPRSERNQVRMMFLNPATRELYPDWAACARENVAYLRMAAGHYPDDPELAALVGELSVKDADFRRWWAEHPVRRKTPLVKRLHHPLVGPMELATETMQLGDDSGQTLVTYTPEPGSPSADALRLLGTLVGSPARPGRPAHAATGGPAR